MRLMGNKNHGVSANTLAQWDVAIQPGYNIDPGLPTQAVPGTTQVIEVPARADWEIQQYITSNTTTGGGTNGVPPWTPYAVSRGGTARVNPPNAPTTRIANGDYNGAAGLGNTQPAGTLLTPEIRQEIAGGAERLGRQAGVIGAAATAASAIPGAHQPITSATAVGATAINIGAIALEQLARPDPGKLVVDTALTVGGALAEHVPVVGPVAAPVTNEMLEAWKNSGTSQSFQQWWNQNFYRRGANSR
jgi:hypothetical protein